MIHLFGMSLLFSAVALILFWIFAWRAGRRLFVLATACLALGTSLLLVYLVVQGMRARSCPAHLSYLTYAFLALLIYLAYFGITLKFPVRLLATFMLPWGFLFQLVSLVYLLTQAGERQEHIRLAMTGVHTGLAMLGQTLFAFAFASALMYLAQEKNLKIKRFDQWFSRLPALGKLEEMATFGIYAGFPLMTCGIAIGAYLAAAKWHGNWYFTRDIVWSMMVWAIFAWLFIGRVTRRIHGRRFLRWVIYGFLSMLASYFITLGSFHGDKNASGGCKFYERVVADRRQS